LHASEYIFELMHIKIKKLTTGGSRENSVK
jgi:hypothetical protein